MRRFIVEMLLKVGFRQRLEPMTMVELFGRVEGLWFALNIAKSAIIAVNVLIKPLGKLIYNR